MVHKNTDIYGFLGPSWVLITYNICPPVIVAPYYICPPVTATPYYTQENTLTPSDRFSRLCGELQNKVDRWCRVYGKISTRSVQSPPLSWKTIGSEISCRGCYITTLIRNIVIFCTSVLNTSGPYISGQSDR